MLIVYSAEPPRPPKKRCLGYDTKLHFMVRLQFWRTSSLPLVPGFSRTLMTLYNQDSFSGHCYFLIVYVVKIWPLFLSNFAFVFDNKI